MNLGPFCAFALALSKGRATLDRLACFPLGRHPCRAVIVELVFGAAQHSLVQGGRGFCNFEAQLSVDGAFCPRLAAKFIVDDCKCGRALLQVRSVRHLHHDHAMCH